MCGPKGYGFSGVLVINRVSILAILVINRVSLFALQSSIRFFLEEATSSSCPHSPIRALPSSTLFACYVRLDKAGNKSHVINTVSNFWLGHKKSGENRRFWS